MSSARVSLNTDSKIFESTSDDIEIQTLVASLCNGAMAHHELRAEYLR